MGAMSIFYEGAWSTDAVVERGNFRKKKKI